MWRRRNTRCEKMHSVHRASATTPATPPLCPSFLEVRVIMEKHLALIKAFSSLPPHSRHPPHGSLSPPLSFQHLCPSPYPFSNSLPPLIPPHSFILSAHPERAASFPSYPPHLSLTPLASCYYLPFLQSSALLCVHAASWCMWAASGLSPCSCLWV